MLLAFYLQKNKQKKEERNKKQNDQYNTTNVILPDTFYSNKFYKERRLIYIHTKRRRKRKSSSFVQIISIGNKIRIYITMYLNHRILITYNCRNSEGSKTTRHICVLPPQPNPCTQMLVEAFSSTVGIAHDSSLVLIEYHDSSASSFLDWRMYT